MNRVVARGQDIGKRGAVGFKSGAESWEQHVGVGRIVCVCVLMSAIFKVLLKSVSYDVSMPTPPIFYVATFISLILARLIF
jgi:hypothetical protein